MKGDERAEWRAADATARGPHHDQGAQCCAPKLRFHPQSSPVAIGVETSLPSKHVNNVGVGSFFVEVNAGAHLSCCAQRLDPFYLIEEQVFSRGPNTPKLHQLHGDCS